MRMPVAAQRASMPVFLCADGDFSTGMVSRPSDAGRGSFATARTLRQVTPHQKCIQLLPAGLLIIAFPPANDLKSGPFIQAPRRLIIFFNLEEHLAYAAAREMTEMRQQHLARQAAATLGRIDGDRQQLRLVGGPARHRKADDPASKSEPVNERI